MTTNKLLFVIGIVVIILISAFVLGPSIIVLSKALEKIKKIPIEIAALENSKVFKEHST